MAPVVQSGEDALTQTVTAAAQQAAAEVYQGESEQVRSALETLATDAAQSAVEELAFEQAVNEAQSRQEVKYSQRKKNADIRYSQRKKSVSATQSLYENRDLSNDKSLYDYDFLVSLPDIQVSTEGDLATVLDESGNIDHAKLKQLGLENAAKYGVVIEDGTVFVENVYTGRLLRVSGSGIDHSTHTANATKNNVNARAGLAAGELAAKAVPLNALHNKARNVLGTYAMAAPLRSRDGKVLSVAVMTVEIKSGDVQQIDVYDLLHALSVRKKNVGGLDGFPSPARTGSNTLSAATRSTYTIADFLEIVNSTHQSLLSEDVLAHFNAQRNPVGYYTDRVKYSQRRATAPSFRQTMMDMEITEDMTALEKELLTKYKGYVQAYNEKQEQINVLVDRMTQPQTKDEEIANRNRMAVYKSQQRRVEKQLYQAEKRGGFANLMSRYRTSVQAYMAGDSVEEAGKNIARQIAAVERELENIFRFFLATLANAPFFLYNRGKSTLEGRRLHDQNAAESA